VEKVDQTDVRRNNSDNSLPSLTLARCELRREQTPYNRTSLMFVQKCLNSENVLVNFVSHHAVFYSRICSGLGRNVQFYCERFGTSLQYDTVGPTVALVS